MQRHCDVSTPFQRQREFPVLKRKLQLENLLDSLYQMEPDPDGGGAIDLPLTQLEEETII